MVVDVEPFVLESLGERWGARLDVRASKNKDWNREEYGDLPWSSGGAAAQQR